MGQKYAAYDSTGAIIAFYDSIDSPPPVDVTILAITDDQWMDCLTNPGHSIVGGILVSPIAPTFDQLLDMTKSAQIQVLSAACQKAIISGFTSSALGEVYSYPSSLVDQQNLASSVLASLMPSSTVAGWITPFWCADKTGIWAFRPHSASQIQTVGEDGKLAILTNMAQNQTLAGSVQVATSIQQVQAINWPIQ